MAEARFTPHYLLENLRDIYFAERSGVLTLQRGSEWRRLYFERGMVSLADSSTARENLLNILAEQGAVPTLGSPAPPDLPATEQARTLSDSGRVRPEELERAARETVARVVTGAFRWDGGTYSFADQEVLSTAFPSDVLFTFEVFQRGVQEMANFAPLQEVLLAEDRRLRLNENAFLPVQSLSLGPEQGYLLSRLDGNLRVADVVALAPEGSDDRVLRMLFGFLVLGVVLFDPPPGEGLFSLRDLMEGHRDDRRRKDEERSRIRTFHDRLPDLAPREVLGIGEGSDPAAVRDAYQRLREEFARERFSPRIRAEMKRELAMIENRLLEAYVQVQSSVIQRLTPSVGELSDPDFGEQVGKRRELVKTEAQATEEENQRQAERFFLRAKDYYRDGDYFNCIQYCKLAVKHNPQEAPFYALLGDALLRNPDHRWQRLAEESYLKATSLDPWNADYLVSLGQLYKAQGLVRRARRQFERALEILPRHQGARQELDGL